MDCSGKLTFCGQISSFSEHFLKGLKSDGNDRLINKSHLVVNWSRMRNLLHFHFAESMNIYKDLFEMGEIVYSQLLF